MILIPDQRIIIITPSKTASCSLHKLLCIDHRYPFIIGSRDQGNGKITYDHHAFIIPSITYFGTDILDDCKIICTVRNPYDRFLSMFFHHNRVNGEISIKDFFSYITSSKDTWYQNISSLVKISGLDFFEFWKIEKLTNHLNTWGLPSNLPLENVSYNRERIEIDFDFINTWAIPDCDMFGYEKSGP